jgi:hypothetical protein
MDSQDSKKLLNMRRRLALGIPKFARSYANTPKNTAAEAKSWIALLRICSMAL